VEALQAELQAAGIPAHRVANGESLMADPQLAARGHWVKRDHPSMGEHLYEMPPFRFAEHDIRIGRSPKLGEHTDQVLADVLGMNKEQIEAARAAGALN